MTNKYNFKVGDKVTANQYYDIDINGYSTTIPIGEEGVIEDIYSDELLVSFGNYGVSLIRPISEFESIPPLDRHTAFLTRLQTLLREFDAEIGDSGIRFLKGMEITFGTDTPRIRYNHCTINADNIMDFDKE
ncbi:MAG: hypothetical protein K2M41_02285 [Muribaculaceae bacterium]|nr:hypothetical protein [Muribaculaceae bacterium]